MYPAVAMVNRHRMIRCSAVALRYLVNSGVAPTVWVSRYGSGKEIHKIDVATAVTNKQGVLPWDACVLTAFDLAGAKWYWWLSWDEVVKIQSHRLPSGHQIIAA